MLHMHRSVRLIPGLLLVILCIACAPAAEVNSASPNRIVYGLTLSPGGFDPHRNESSELGIPMRQVYDTLIYRNPTDGGFVPGLATDWSISDDRLTYSFNLRQDVKFHDDTKFNALAVAANLDRIVNRDTRSTKALTLLGTYAGYELTGEYSINLKLAEPYSPLLDSLSQLYLGIASPTALAQYATMPERYQFHQVGTGPYMMSELILDNRLVLRRNPNYTWGPSFYLPADDNMVEEIEYRFFADPPTRFTALESGTASIMGEIPPLTARSMTGNSQIQLFPAAVAGQPQQFLINTRLFPTDNLAFRQALVLGTNRSAINDIVFQGFSPVAWGPITSNTQFYNNAMNGLYEYDSQEAIALLASAGYIDADLNGYLDDPSPDKEDVEVKIIVPPWGATPQIAQLIQDQWKILGIKALLTPVPDFSTLLDLVTQGDYNLVAFYTFGVDPAFLNSFFTTDGSRNWTGFSNPELDRMLFDAQLQLESGTRNTLYGNAQQMIMDNALILPIREYVNLNGAVRDIEGLTFDPYGWFPLMANVRLKQP
ncbi:MAG: hypothetical protein H7X77_07140 [Anaerolineae bacterium]|nr:hypothetical protein [Anaerolineae bacterium]